MLKIDSPVAEATAKAIVNWPGWRKTKDGFEAPYYASAAMPWYLRSPAVPPDVSMLVDDQARADEVLNSGEKPFPYNLPKRKLLDHQRRAIQAAGHMGWRVLLTDDMGLGKTTEALGMVQHSHAYSALIICPKGLRQNWADEIRSCFGDEPLVAIIDGYKPATRLKRLDNALDQLKAGRQVFAIAHYNMFPRAADMLLLAFRQFIERADAIVCDESHAIKNRTAQTTKAIKELVDKADPQVRIVATGTPVRNQVDDLYSQIELLHPGTWISYADFERRYLQLATFDVNLPNGRTKKVRRTVGSKNLNELNNIVKTVQIRRKKTEVLHLPEMMESFPRLEMDDATKFWYKNLRERAIIALSEIEPTLTIFDPKVSSAMEQAVRCAQVCQGYIGGLEEDHADIATMIDVLECIPKREQDLAIPESSKIQWVLEHVQEVVKQGNQAVIFGNYNSPLFWIMHQLEVSNVDARMIHGGVDSTARHEAVRSFQAGEVRVLCSQVAIAEGWTATAAQDAFFIGRNWSPAVNEQASARLHRIGQTGMVNIYTPIMAGTIEEKIHDRLKLKGETANRAIQTMTVKDLLSDL